MVKRFFLGFSQFVMSHTKPVIQSARWVASLVPFVMALPLAPLFAPTTAQADQIMIISGGGSPRGNHYSQYLQTKTLTDGLRTMVPRLDLTVHFGAGNEAGRSPILADVHRVVTTAVGSREVMIPGAIAQNLPATRSSITASFRAPKMSRMRADETLFLFVSDHGMPFQFPNGSFNEKFENNCIDLWGFSADFAADTFSTSTPAERCLSKDQLAGHLNRDVSAGRVVFSMSQCFSGGFHRMSIRTTGSYPTADARICGFTAITEDTTASGCTPDVDGPGYQGYERSFTEQLTGVDVVSGRSLRPARKSVQEAHREATLEDFAKDIPLATSDFYLWKWALAIDDSNFVPRVAGVSADQARAVLATTAIGQGSTRNALYREKDAFFLQMQLKFESMYPRYKATFRGSLAAHKALETQLSQDLKRVEQESGSVWNSSEQSRSELLKLWNAHVRQGASALTSEEAKLETDLFGYFDEKDGAGAGHTKALYIMSMRVITNSAKANAISEYQATRGEYATSWALASGETRLVTLARKLLAQDERGTQLDEEATQLQRVHGHVRRLLIYRQALGAWNALSAMSDQQALRELSDLLDCERTSF